MNDLIKQWADKGYILLKSILSEKEISTYLNEIRKISNLKDIDVEDVIKGEKNLFVVTNEMVQNETFWPLFFHKNILEAIRKYIDKDICFSAADALYVHRSADVLHRDSFIDHTNLIGPSFDPNLNNLCTVRAISYFHENISNELLIVPGSHKKTYPNKDTTKFKDFQDIAVSIELEPGDVLIFDAMLLHAGRYIKKPKYAAVWTYASRNKHTIIGKYYAQVVNNYKMQFPNELIKKLENNNLYWNELFNDHKYLEYYNNLWENMPKNQLPHWSPYIEELY